MDTISLPAHFDGKQILLDQPFDLEPNARLIVTVLPKQDIERESWLGLSADKLQNAYGEDEIDYSLASIKTANPDYAGS